VHLPNDLHNEQPEADNDLLEQRKEKAEKFADTLSPQ
jgi:hypothetical protein